MRNICLTLAYDGTDYVGWQIQPNGVSVQSVVETAIQKLTGEKVRLMAAGRTDSGVHALGQVAAFPTNSDISCKKIKDGLIHFLPEDVTVRDVKEVAAKFHPTYSAKQKRYRYVIYNSRDPEPFLRKYVWHFWQELDVAAMHEAGQVLLGKHDFRCFESHFPNKATSVRTIKELTVGRFSGWPIWNQFGALSNEAQPDANGKFICLDIVADGFLYNMVRAITGTLLKVGQGRWSKEHVKNIVKQQDRSQAGETAPPQGLYLVKVDYEP
jgi:tRNA pseudouridine38-40 synthase